VKSLHTPLFLTLLAPLVAPSTVSAVAPNAPAERLQFTPTEGLRLTRDVHTQQYLSLDEVTLESSGREQNPKQYLDIVSTEHVRVTDEFQAVGADRPVRLRRTYEQLELDCVAEVLVGTGRREARPMKGSSPLAGKSVVFTWVPDRGDYGCYYDLERAPEHLLADVRQPMDFAGFLPAKEVSVGDTWSIEPAVLRDVLAAGGLRGYRIDAGDDPVMPRLVSSGAGAELAHLFGRTTGRFDATFREQRDVDGRSYAVIGFEFEVRSESDLSRLAKEAMSQLELAAGTQAESFLTKSSFAGRGELLWDAAAGHAKSLELQCNSWFERKERFVAPAQVQGGTMQRTMTLKGTITVKADISPAQV